MKQILIIAAVLIAHNGYSQLDWSHTFGSTGIDRAGNIHTVNNDSYVFTSIENYSGSSGNTVVKKLDLTGSELWTQSYGNNLDDECLYMRPTANGDFVLSGFTRSYASVGYTGTVNLYSASWIFKIDANGNQIWTRSIGGESYGDNYGGHITLSLLDEPVRWGQVQYHSGCNNYSTSLTKLNTNGSNVWSYCEAVVDGGIAVSRLLTVNEYIAGGIVATGDPSSITLRKYNDLGDEIWSVNYNPGDGNEGLQSISSSIDGGFYAIGHITGSTFEQNDIFIAKFTTDGILEWERFYGFSENDYAGELIETNNGHLAFTGQTRSNNNTTSRAWVMKLDLSGDLISEYFYGNGDDFRAGSFICEAPDGDFVISGYSNETGNQESLVFKVGLCESNASIQTISACETYTWINGVTYDSSTNNPTWILTNTEGCDSIVTLNLTINPLPDVSLTLTNNVLEAVSSEATYQWLDCDDDYAEINEEINQNYTPNVTGNYAVELNLNGCSDTSECLLVDYTNLFELNSEGRVLTKIIDLMGRDSKPQKNKVLIYVYSDGTTEKIFDIE